jgi:hypothetical protein
MNLDRKQKRSQEQKWKKKEIHTFFNRLIIDTSFCRMQTTIHQRLMKQSTKRRKTIVSRAIISKKSAEISIVKNAQNFLKKKKIVAIVKRTLKKKNFSIHRLKISRRFEKISTQKRREQRRFCFERLNKKCLEQKSDVQRFVFEVSHHTIYFEIIWFVCATNTIFCRKNIDETWKKEWKRETFWFWQKQTRRVE